MHDRPAKDIVDAIHTAVLGFTEGSPPADDITVVIARRTKPSPNPSDTL
jgi:serine phosphatase RsbU (regulator of sigma subunit)